MTKRNHIATTIAIAVLSLSSHAFASTVGANHGHHGGGNSGALGAATGAPGANSSASGQGQSGNGGSYWSPNPNASLIDAYQPYPQAEMRQFQKP